ncbi:MAG: hypothetical protein K2O31_06060, partial [Clostridia bacterium]|nr:hypothetical protein [Clostridia bacterium]
ALSRSSQRTTRYEKQEVRAKCNKGGNYSRLLSLTLAQDASACSLCRRFAPYDCSVAEWRNLNNIRHLTTANGGASPQGEAKCG